MLLAGPHLQLIPYTSQDWKTLARWAYDEKYAPLFRFHPKVFEQEELLNYPRSIGADVFMVTLRTTGQPVGMIQMTPDTNLNRGFFCGLLLEEEYQKHGYAAEAIALLFYYAFNNLDYRKAIVLILSTDESLKDIVNKAGFLKEGHLFGEVFFQGEFRDELRYCMMASFFNKKYKGMVESWQAHSANS